MIKRVMKNLKKVSVYDVGMIKIGTLLFGLWLASFIPQELLFEARWYLFVVFLIIYVKLTIKFTKK